MFDIVIHDIDAIDELLDTNYFVVNFQIIDSSM